MGASTNGDTNGFARSSSRPKLAAASNTEGRNTDHERSTANTVAYTSHKRAPFFAGRLPEERSFGEATFENWDGEFLKMDD